MNNYSSGQITNLVANDANKIEYAHYFFNHLWVRRVRTINVLVNHSFRLHLYKSFSSLFSFGISSNISHLLPLGTRSFCCFSSHYLVVVLCIYGSLVRWERLEREQWICFFLGLNYWKSLMNVWKSCQKSLNQCVSWKCIVGKQHSMRKSKLFESTSIFFSSVHWSSFLLLLSRREIIQTGLLTMSMSGQTVLTHSYISIMLLLMYGAMWSFDIQFDTRFFAINLCILAYMQISVMMFFALGIRDFAQYFSAQRRIKVGDEKRARDWDDRMFCVRHFCYLMSQNEIIVWHLHRSYNW